MRYRLFTLAFMLILSASNLAFAQSKLGLADRRALKEYQDKIFPDMKKAIDQAAGFAPTLDVQWEKIARPNEGENYQAPEYWGFVFFKPLAAALKKIASDDMGKKALKDGLKTIVITYDEATAPASNWPNGLKFEKNTLTINFAPYTNADDENGGHFKDRVEAIVKLLESKL